MRCFVTKVHKRDIKAVPASRVPQLLTNWAQEDAASDKQHGDGFCKRIMIYWLQDYPDATTFYVQKYEQYP